MILILAVAALTLLGCTLADRGCKKIGGYFDDNVVFSVTADDTLVQITLFNEQMKFRR